ncbi:MAG: hypothetical protein IJI62_03705, partial [Lachnospiraceae bacterium]|nr:hypothetical protein [Lachnospiraceae bacterium]
IDSLGQELPEVNACGADGHCLAKTRLGWQTIAMKQESPASAGGGRFNFLIVQAFTFSDSP